MLELDLDESDISGASDDSDIDENWEPGNSLLEGGVEDDEDEGDQQETNEDHQEALLDDLVPPMDIPCGSGSVLDDPNTEYQTSVH